MIRYLFFVLLIFWSASARADIRLAVLEFRGVDVSPVLLHVLADDVRLSALEIGKSQKTSSDRLIVMTRENINQILVDQGLTVEESLG